MADEQDIDRQLNSQYFRGFGDLSTHARPRGSPRTIGCDDIHDAPEGTKRLL